MTPLAAVRKGDNSVRLRGNHCKTVNPILEMDRYPLPHPKDLMAVLAGGHRFSKPGLSAAYQQQ